jgi:hypothetical protein
MSKFDGILSVKSGTSAKKESKAISKGTSEPKNGKAKATGKRSNPDYTQITAYIKKETHENVMRTIYKQQEFSELIEELLTSWMKNAK